MANMKKLFIAEMVIGLTFTAITAFAQSAEEATDKTTGMEFIFVKGDCFQMGDIFDDGFAIEQKPVHEVCLDNFYMGKYEVTQRQWKKLMGSNPSKFSNCGDDCPVDQISWNDAQTFIEKLNRSSGKKYRLPTEAEWEYAARSGGKNEKWAGTSSESSLGEYAWYSANSGGNPHPVGQKKPNGLGLFDMTGNVWEWCSDWYGKYSSSSVSNPKGPFSEGSDFLDRGRINRGGGWNHDAQFQRYRGRMESSKNSYVLGLRLVTSPIVSQNALAVSFRGITVGKILNEQMAECKTNAFMKNLMKYNSKPSISLDQFRKDNKISEEGICWYNWSTLLRQNEFEIDHLPSVGIGGPVTVKTLDDKVENITMDFAYFNADKFLAMLKAKYGEPVINKAVIQNRMGASFDKVTALWKIEDCELLYIDRFETIDSGILIISSKKYIENMKEKEANKIKEGAGKL